MPDYKNGKIYKLIDNTNGNVYIGSTTQTISRRLDGHRGHYKDYLKGKSRCCKSFTIIKNNDYKIELICDYPCDNINELHIKEQEFINKCDCINIQQAYQSKENRKQYLRTNRLKVHEFRLNKDRMRYQQIKSWGSYDNSLYYTDTTLFL